MKREQRPAAADELDPGPAAELLPRRNRDDADRAGTGDMRAAVAERLTSTSISRSVPSRPDSFLMGSFAASAASTKRIVTGRSSHTMRFASASALATPGSPLAPGRWSTMKRRGESLGPRLERRVEGSRQDVLPGVLLHVVEAPPRR